MPDDSWLTSLRSSFKSQTATWVVAFVIAILSLFSVRITENIRFAINKADSRSQQYQDLASDVSQFLFSAELATEYLSKNLTSKESIQGFGGFYNEGLSKLRKNEYVYLFWLEKFWGTRELNQFNRLMDKVKAFDSEIHALNDEIEGVLYKGKDRIDPQRAKNASVKLGSLLTAVKQDGLLFLKMLL